MAKRACLELGGLVVKRRSAGRIREGRRGVALQAQDINVTYFEHVRVGRAVRHVAGGAALDFDRLMFENERAVLVHVALVTNGVLRRG